jgi:nucleotide-binding universal stress UspA family protein
MAKEATHPTRVLVTYDGSPASRAALEPAARLAGKLGAELILLQVHHPGLKLAVVPDPEEREKLLREAEEEMEANLEALARELEGRVRPLLRRLGKRWNVVDEILYTADEFDAELICMATHGDSAVRHFIAGSTAMDVLSKSRRPVLLVRSET